MCRHVCTVATQTASETDSPNGKCQLAWLILRGRQAFTEPLIQSMYKCATCNLCKASCLTKIDVAKVVEAARADIITLNKGPRSVVALGKTVKRVHNVYGQSHETRFADLAKEEWPRKNKATTLYFVGCTVAYFHPEIAKAVTKVFRLAGVEFTVMNGEEWCCGLPLYQMGLRDTARKLAEHNAQAIKKIGCKTVIASCPGCYEALKTRYPEWGVELNAEILHTSEYLESLIESGAVSLVRAANKRVTYHDPCHLGRYLGVYDPPRRIIGRIPGVRFVEMRWNREKAHCCGSGGGLQLIYPELTTAIGRKRVDEAIKVGVEVLVTTCPSCKRVFCNSVRETESVQIYDITELVVQAL